jgi:hypothetical protein
MNVKLGLSVEIDGVKFSLDENSARQLYEKLKQIFDKGYIQFIPSPVYPIPQYVPYPVYPTYNPWPWTYTPVYKTICYDNGTVLSINSSGNVGTGCSSVMSGGVTI